MRKLSIKTLNNYCSQEKLLYIIFILGLSRNEQSMLDTSCVGSFMTNTIEFKWHLLERIKRNSEDWDFDDGKESGMTPKFDCVNLLCIPMLFVDLALNMDLTLRW